MSTKHEVSQSVTFGPIDQTPGTAGSDEIKFCDQGLVLNGRPNLKLFNQLYWTITFAFVAVGHVVFPLPHLVSGTFPAESRYRPIPQIFPLNSRRGRICLLRDIGGFEDEGLRSRLILLVATFLLILFIWHFNVKVLSLDAVNLSRKMLY